MASIRITVHGFVAIVSLTIATLISATTAPAQNIGKQEDGEGKYANLTAQWMQWLFAQPAVDVGGTNTNPALDSTGAYAAAGQENGIGPGSKYFFLAGTFGGTAVRTVTVPKGKALFFPVIAANFDDAVDPRPPTPFKVPELRAQAKAFGDSITSAAATLNDVPVEVFRTKSPTFDYTLPDENSIYEYFGLVGPQFEGRVKPSVGDGYWCFIPPLPSGSYVLEFEGANSFGLSLSVTYFLSIP
jgi:hypothetical protein